MKKLLTFCFVLLMVTLQACQEKSPDDIEMVTPLQVYEAVYGQDALQLVDVRTTEEYGVSHLKNAQNICVTSDDFKEKVEKLDKEKPVYVYCKKGGRSAKAARILKEMGFTKVYDLQGGMTSWQDRGLETVQMP